MGEDGDEFGLLEGAEGGFGVGVGGGVCFEGVGEEEFVVAEGAVGGEGADEEPGLLRGPGVAGGGGGGGGGAVVEVEDIHFEDLRGGLVDYFVDGFCLIVLARLEPKKHSPWCPLLGFLPEIPSRWQLQEMFDTENRVLTVRSLARLDTTSKEFEIGQSAAQDVNGAIKLIQVFPVARWQRFLLARGVVGIRVEMVDNEALRNFR